MDRGLPSLIESSRAISQPYNGNFRVDDNVLAKFPDGTTVLSADSFGTSAWTVTARLHLKLPDGSEERYFLKSAPEDHGRTLMEGEFNAMSEIYKWAPDLVPKPHSWGEYALKKPEAYFFLSQYIDMNDMMPDPNQLCTKLARLHRESQSPTGQFGFHITTCQGRIPQSLTWESNWTVFFTQLLKHVIDMDFEYNGYWEELDRVEKQLIAHVIPRLLDALVKDGRKIKPSLIHGDLWEGNSGTSFEDNNIYIFDAAAFYAHHEMEVGDWRCYYNKISNRVYTRTYLRHRGPSEPKDEWEDRNRLYSIYFNTIYSVNHLGTGKAVRQLAYQDMYYLIDKYAPFPEGEGPPKLDKSEMVSLSAERDHTAN
ncbi:hypothetical protein M441DRAFT_40114 [Trichoderma asperellum CBS 433.97]|uniref:protein-ribulosamine 3-kinase n=1 Tax=Trichoderma asperellum (strain ATCC 204424 / CBS 433.97 / NBRC 101777) TaxID=1042311 RepID=A0A2T3YXW5_TRIA4|nr:hypothetical protein M441DRAFT_40114 [Trichoderma asperellum CBS 433.97]PTB37377.1 hypothetical protein M441DRAFT_40114 [Trichoderma asperellum CBS 433.97]